MDILVRGMALIEEVATSGNQLRLYSGSVWFESRRETGSDDWGLS
jgi:hypothetical protein